MELFRGSTVEVVRPEILAPVRTLDFGAGFYTTSSVEQAERWARLQKRRRGANGAVISIYGFDVEAAIGNLATLEFKEPDGDWLDFVVSHRKGLAAADLYDLVVGPVADDDTMTVINDYMDGRYTKAEAVTRLLPQRLVDQYAFLSEAALSFLGYEGARTL
ncbi:MAG: DUF3990 domain-containing protein [Coriobacteriales bacterium]|nr:DUF3990 domain-containing protein [Coriobacteriales bacterium]